MQMSKKHQEVGKDGIGWCSVPMWLNGMPAGFCDCAAYGEELPYKTYCDHSGKTRRYDGKTIHYILGLACPAHGGPTSRCYRDGNQWCAVNDDFINLQESHAGFGDTKDEARAELAKLGVTNGS